MFSLMINGQKRQIDVPADTPLLWALRDEFKLTGTKFGCGIGQCGACTVHLNGSPARSCSLPISTLDGSEIRTIEGLENKHPLQKAWVEHQVPQCGYCQSGQIMQASTLLATNANPSDAEIINHMTGNLCRCMSYKRIKEAIKQVSSASASVVEIYDPKRESILENNNEQEVV